MKIPAALVEVLEVLTDSVEDEIVGGLAVELDPPGSVNSDVEMWVPVTEAC